jgi:hypothetical protein
MRWLQKQPRVKGARRTYVDGIGFQSKNEAERYKELKLLEKAGEIHTLKLQQRYPLRVNTVLICTYVADFTYFEKLKCGERFVVEDAKGWKTEGYRFKKKLFEAVNDPLRITETKGGRS